MESNINKKNQYLKMIVESFINYGLPIGSENLIKQNNLSVSSATVRNIMFALEKDGYLEKHYNSSGRIPSIKGIQYYANYLTSSPDQILKSRLKDIFAKRRLSIDETIDEAAEKISNLIGLTFITSNDVSQELLKSITLTAIDNNQAIIVLITSTGKIENKKFLLNEKIKFNDLKIAIRFIQERLINTPLSELGQKITLLEPILKEKIKNIEELIITFVEKIFDFAIENNPKIYGKSFIIQSEEIKRNDLAKLINMIEHQSIWDSIENRSLDDENLKIDIGHDNTAIISKKMIINGSSKEMSIIGSHRMDYSKAKNILNIIEKFIKE